MGAKKNISGTKNIWENHWYVPSFSQIFSDIFLGRTSRKINAEPTMV
jgi:hypothetical protein